MPNLAAPYHADAALERGVQGYGLSREDALSLMNDAPLAPLLDAAATVRDHFKGYSVSFSRKVFIPLTHLCRDYCGYCTFRADPQARVQPYLTPAEVLAGAEAVRPAGCKEAVFSLGDLRARLLPDAREVLTGLAVDCRI